MFPFSFEPTEEQLAELERAKLAADIYKMRFQALLAEIDNDDLDVLHSIFAHILNAQEPRHVANFYYGVVFGARGVRTAVFGDDEDSLENLLEQ